MKNQWQAESSHLSELLDSILAEQDEVPVDGAEGYFQYLLDSPLSEQFDCPVQQQDYLTGLATGEIRLQTIEDCLESKRVPLEIVELLQESLIRTIDSNGPGFINESTKALLFMLVGKSVSEGAGRIGNRRKLLAGLGWVQSLPWLNGKFKTLAQMTAFLIQQQIEEEA